jgi:hypothetical protein
MDWFERLTGFTETSYAETRARLAVEGSRLRSRVNGKSYAIGELELLSLDALRRRAPADGGRPRRLTAKLVRGDVRAMHRLPENAGALFQVASQFNLLEMVAPDVTPEAGVTRYQHDRTQGPACAIAAGAATIYRNYFAPVANQQGQTAERQIDALAELGTALSDATGQPVAALWRMQNGYALATQTGLQAIAACLEALSEEQRDALRGKLCIGLHRDVEVTDAEGDCPLVSQAFCSALPVAYTKVPAPLWAPFARLVLEAAYEATLRAAVLNAARGASNVVLLTSLGGGAFGNDESWIGAAMERALTLMAQRDLAVRLVSFGAPSPTLARLADMFA